MPNFDSLRVGDQLPQRQFTPTNVSLFMYNAAIWNAHRIHYDERYTTEVEAHPGVVIDGPLQGDWLAQVVCDWLADAGQLLSFEYTNRHATYLGETLCSGGAVAQIDATNTTVTLDLFVKNAAGEVTTPGKAIVRF
jgi:hydroxyacyl-ACP dehydratase HTD2-like protein with hotdog domain